MADPQRTPTIEHVNELPPDPVRLRAILRHLETAIADNDTVHTYLDLQRNAVLDALRAAEGGAPADPRPPAPAPEPSRARDDAPSGDSGYQVDRTRTPDGPVGTSIHLTDCRQVSNLARPVTAERARSALVEGLEACQFCRPDTELGMLDG